MNEIITIEGNLTPQFKQEYINIDKEIKELEARIKELKKQKEERNALILEAMDLSNTMLIDNEDIRILFTDADYKEVFDVDTFMEEHLDLYNHYTSIKPVDAKITVTVRANKKGK